MNARLVTIAERDRVVSSHLSIDDAARVLRVSDSTLRRVVRRLGVRRIAGPTVAGFILVDEPTLHRLPIAIAYHA